VKRPLKKKKKGTAKKKIRELSFCVHAACMLKPAPWRRTGQPRKGASETSASDENGNEGCMSFKEILNP